MCCFMMADLQQYHQQGSSGCAGHSMAVDEIILHLFSLLQVPDLRLLPG
jgi:hypothetical protein